MFFDLKEDKMENVELRQLAKANPEEALLIAWEMDDKHPLADEINDSSVIVKLSRSRNELVANWAYRKIRSFEFTDSLKVLKEMKDRSRPWETALCRTLYVVQTIEQFKQVASLISSYDSVWLFSCAERVLQDAYSHAKTKKDFSQLLVFVEYLSKLDLELSSAAYGRQFDYDKYSSWQKEIHEKLFELIKDSKNDLLAIVSEDKFQMKRHFGQQATALLAQM
jgi:hypothetical protein